MSEKEVKTTEPKSTKEVYNPYYELAEQFNDMEGDFKRAFEGDQKAAKRRVRKSLSLFAKQCKTLRASIDPTKSDRVINA